MFHDACITKVMQREIKSQGYLSTPHFAVRSLANQVRADATQRMSRNVQCLVRFGTLPRRQSALSVMSSRTFTAGLSCDRPTCRGTHTASRATCPQPWASVTVAPVPMHGNPRHVTLVIDSDVIQCRRRRYAPPQRG